NDIKEIKKHLPKLEIEVFIHGSMCFAYSGRCLISAVQSGRVPNRGSCANDCRFAYTLYAKNEESGTLFKVEQQEEGTYIFNAKDLNLISYVDEIIKSGVVDAVKIEGRTKSPYYVAQTTRIYRQAIDDNSNEKFNIDFYKEELETIKNRGFTEGYLIQRPFEKDNTQNLKSTLLEGTHQVYAIVNEDGVSFRAKDKVEPNVEYEIIIPKTDRDDFVCNNEIGEIYKDNSVWKIKFNKIQATNEKILDAVHSGNTLDIKLPNFLPPFSFLRKKIYQI
ncbi:MAG: U32 family peptidase, partial [Campylobacteraceae bacterium]|nr:U32 family peptidase [Campylobacteraceae bacterium]